MKLIIAGSRTIDGPAGYREVIKAVWNAGYRSFLDTADGSNIPALKEVTEVVSGGARGVDSLGEDWASVNWVSIRRFPANWEKYGKSAGFRRNVEMAEYAGALVAVWDGESRGTKHMIECMQERGKPVYIHYVEPLRPTEPVTNV